VGRLKTARSYHTATLLRNGKVLVAGGYSGAMGSVVLASTELYDPASDRWSDAAPMLVPHASHSAGLLPDGKVLIASGRSSNGDTTAAEIYDPGANAWKLAGNLAVARVNSQAIVLANGRVVVIGGDGGATPPAELYDPGLNAWSKVPNTSTSHVNVAASLRNGKVLILGGQLAWTYDPNSNSASSVAPPPALLHAATVLGDGRVLLVGSLDPSLALIAELYDPVANRWSFAAAMEPNGVWGTATALPDGRVLVAGSPVSAGGAGCGPDVHCVDAEVYDPAKNVWTVTAGMATSRGEHTSTLLTNGKVLVAGGSLPPNPDMTASAEIFDPFGG